MAGIGWLIVKTYLLAYYTVTGSAILTFIAISAATMPCAGQAEIVAEDDLE